MSSPPKRSESVNSSDLIDAITAIVPSFNVRRYAIADGATFVRPTELRGLDAHHTLVLINGKRRHRSALLRLGGFGAHGPDLGSLPSIAIDRLEILRDGAAAQYGSDAIAGVMDLKLASESRGFELRGRAGGYSAGDGEEVVVEAKAGFPLGRGFLTLSAQVAEAAPTNRSEPYDIPIGSSGLTPAQAVTSRLTVGGTTYHGPDAFTYRYAANGDLVQVLPGSDGVPDDLDTRYADNFHRVGGGREFSHPAQVWGKPEREQRLVVVNARRTGRHGGTLRVRQLRAEGLDRRLFLPAPRRQPTVAAAPGGRVHLRPARRLVPGRFHAAVQR